MVYRPGPAIFLCMLMSAAQAPQAADSTVYDQDGYAVVKKTAVNGDWTYVLSDTKAGSALEVTQLGANLKSFTATVRGTAYSVLQTNGSWKMMPWANRTRAGKFTDAAGITRDLFVRDAQGVLLTEKEPQGSAIHGMVRARKWTVDGIGSDSEGVYLKCYFDTEGFPAIEALFGAFRDHTLYRLKGGRLILDAFTENKADRPFANCGWGFHPWFNAPLLPLNGAPQKGAPAKTSLLLPARTIATYDATKIPIGTQPVAAFGKGYFDFTRLRPVDRDTITDHYFTDLIEEGSSGFSRSVLIDYGNAVRIQVLAQFPFYPWLVMFNPKPGIVAIEPQTEEVNALNTKQHFINIPAKGKSPVGRMVIELDGDTTLAFKGAVTALSRMKGDPDAGQGSEPHRPAARLLRGGAGFKAEYRKEAREPLYFEVDGGWTGTPEIRDPSGQE